MSRLWQSLEGIRGLVAVPATWRRWLGDEFDTSVRTKALDLFAYAEANRIDAIPRRGKLVVAGFEVYFTSHPKPRMVYVRDGNKLRLTRHCK